MAENYVSSDVNQGIVSSVKLVDSHQGKESKSDGHSKGRDSTECSDIKAESQNAPKRSIRNSIPGKQTAVHETDNKGPTEAAAQGQSDNDSWAVALAQYDEQVRNKSVLDAWHRHSTSVSAKPCWSTSQSLSHDPQYGPKSQDHRYRSRRGLTRGLSDFSLSQDDSKISNWEKAFGLQTARRSSSTNIDSNGWDSWVVARYQTDKCDTMITKECTPRCCLMDEKHAPPVSQEIVSSVKRGDPYHEKEPKSDYHSKRPKRARCSDIKTGHQPVSKCSVQDGIHGNRTAVHKTDNKGHTNDLAGAHHRNDNDGWPAAHDQSNRDSWAAALDQQDEQARNSSILDGWQRYSTSISKKHDQGMPNRGFKHGPSHVSQFEYETCDERYQSGGRLTAHVSDSVGSKDGSKSSNWEKAIGLQSASRSFSSNKVTSGWDPWVAARDQTNRWGRKNSMNQNPTCVLMNEKHAPTVSQEILSSEKPDDSYHEKEPRLGQSSKFAETDNKEKTDNWSAALDQHDAWLRNTSSRGGWNRHPSVSTKYGRSTTDRSCSRSPSHGSRYGSETWDDRYRSRKGLSTSMRDFSGSKDCLESSNWEKAIGSQTVSRSFSPEKESNAWDPWIAACNQTNGRRKSMSSGHELWGEHSCDIKLRHGSSQSGRNISNTIKYGPRGSDNSGQTGAGEFPIACPGIACNKDDSRGLNSNSVSGDLTANRVGMSETSTGRWGAALDRADKSMPPDRDSRRRQGRGISPQVCWKRLESNTSRSPSSVMKSGSKSWNRRDRTGAGGSTRVYRDHEDSAWRKSDNITRETRGNRPERRRHLSHHSRERFTYSTEQSDHSRDGHCHWDVPHHGSWERFTYSVEQRDHSRDRPCNWDVSHRDNDWVWHESYLNNKPTSCSHGFVKERHRGALTSYDITNVHEDAPSHGQLSMREESGQSSHDRKNVDSAFKLRLVPRGVGGAPCKYFAEAQCYYGENCKFPHQLELCHPKDRQHDDVHARQKDTRSTSSLNSQKQGDGTSTIDLPNSAYWIDVDVDAKIRAPLSNNGCLLRKTEQAQWHTVEPERSERDLQQSPEPKSGLSQQLVHSVVPNGLHDHSSPWHPLNTNGFPSDVRSHQILKIGDANSLQGESAQLYSVPSVSQAVETGKGIACVTSSSTTPAMVSKQPSQLYTGSTWIASTATPPVPPGFSPVDQGFSGQHHNTDNWKDCGTHAEAVDPYFQTNEWTKDENVMKMLKFELVDLVKDLLKPAWKNGNLSRETHKTIVKKVVDKVISSINGPDIPQTKEMVDIYLLESKSNIGKLVQGYVEKYMNS
ncbi:putative transcription factor C3H family [Dioscorea sansibarensis]